MDSKFVLQIDNLSKKFCRNLRKSMLYGVADVGREIIGIGSNNQCLRPEEFWAIKDLSLYIEQGEWLGIVGPNGAGKSTLLKLISGIFPPDEGRICVNGSIGSLIEVGAGLHPMLTGRENIYLKGAVLGISKKTIDEKFDEIINFSGLEKFIDTPVKYYSSGMQVRLGFSIATYCEPDLFIVDEALAVGDAEFRARCIERMREMKNKGVAIIYVSHNLNFVRELCNTGFLLVGGHGYDKDKAHKIVDEYQRLIRNGLTNKTLGKEEDVLTASRYKTFRSGKKEYLEIVNIEFSPCDGREVNNIAIYDDISIKVEIKAHNKVLSAGVSIRIRSSDEIGLLGWTSHHSNISVDMRSGESQTIQFVFRNILRPDAYTIDVAATRLMIPGAKEQSCNEDQIDGALRFVSVEHPEHPVWQRVYQDVRCYVTKE